MQTVHRVPAVSLSTGRASESSGELLAIPVFEQDDLGDMDGLDTATGGETKRARERGEFRGKPFEIFLTPANNDTWRPGRVAPTRDEGSITRPSSRVTDRPRWSFPQSGPSGTPSSYHSRTA